MDEECNYIASGVGYRNMFRFVTPERMGLDPVPAGEAGG